MEYFNKLKSSLNSFRSQFFKSKSNLDLMKKLKKSDSWVFYHYLVYQTKNERKIMALLKKSNYHKWVCWIAFTKIKKEKNILLVMKRNGYDKEICFLGMIRLRSKKRILQAMHESKFSKWVCEEGIKTLKFLQNKSEGKMWKEVPFFYQLIIIILAINFILVALDLIGFLIAIAIY